MDSEHSAAKSRLHSVLLCGEKAFAARGLVEILQNADCRVSCFSRGDVDRVGEYLTGAVELLHTHPYLDQHYDTVINFIFLDGESIESNTAYLRSLLHMCREQNVNHLIHISSISVYSESTRLISENSPIKESSGDFGEYTNVKVAADHFLRQASPPGLRLSLVRPAFIIAEGVTDVIGAIGTWISGNRLLVLGNGKRTRPLITRQVLHQSLLRLVLSRPNSTVETILLVDPQSPTCLEYLQACCLALGVARHALALPFFLWAPFFLAHELQENQNQLNILQFFRDMLARSQKQVYDPSWSERRLGLSLHADWFPILAYGKEPKT